MQIVLDVDGGVQAGDQLDMIDFAASAVDFQGDLLMRAELFFKPLQRKGLMSRDPQALQAVLLLELQGKHAHPDEVAAVDSLKTFRDNGAHAEERSPLGRPVSGATHPVVFAGKDDQRDMLFGVDFTGVENRHLFAFRHQSGESPLFAFDHLVADPHVGKGAAHHDVVVAAAASIAIEIVFFNAKGSEVEPRWGVRFKGAGRRNVVGRDRIAKEGERAHFFELFALGEFSRTSFKERRALDVCAFGIPGILRAFFRFDFLP
jgi:hypothetical protein